MTPLDWGADNEQPIRVCCATRARRVVLGQTGLGCRHPRLGLLLGGTCFLEPLRGCRSGARQAFCTFAIAGGQGQRRLCVSARALKLRQVGWCRWRREEPRELLSTGYARAKGDLHDARQAAIDGRDNVRGAARPRFEARRYAYRLTYRLLLNDRSTEIQAPLLFLEEADAWRVLAGASAGRVCGIGIRIHIDGADPVLIAESFGLQHDHQFAFSALRRLDVDAEDARTGRGVDAEHFRLTAPPSRRTSTMPSVSALKESSCVR